MLATGSAAATNIAVYYLAGTAMWLSLVEDDKNLCFEFYLPPLVIRIDIPYYTLSKYFVFIECWNKIKK
jgi:hypothetical protein